jgi:hypothetical protein
MAAAGASARALPAPAGARPSAASSTRRNAVRPAPPPPRRALAGTPCRRACVVFGVLLAVLAVGRVALSFAVVQKNLQTDAVARQYRALDAQNQQLAETAAGLSSALAVRNVAMKKLPPDRLARRHSSSRCTAGHTGTRTRR